MGVDLALDLAPNQARQVAFRRLTRRRLQE